MFSAEATYHSSACAVIDRLNHGLFRRAIENKFLTTFYGMLAKDGSFTYCNAGHNAPILISGTTVRRLETGGMVLGLFELASFEEETVQLHPGDVIIAFSDGVTEAMNEAGDEFTDDRLIASLAANRGRPPQELIDGVIKDVRAFCGEATQSDDLTILGVHFSG